MKLKNKNILIISPEPWDHLFISKHHYATHLAKKGNKVFFLNPPSKEFNCQPTEYENVYSVQYSGFIKALRFFPRFLQKQLIKMKFEKIQKLCEIQLDIVWSFDNSVFFDFSSLPHEVFSFSHIVDLNQDFEFKRASVTADLCLASSKYIVEKQKKYNQNSHNIGHGFNRTEGDLKHFEITGSNKFNCAYAGNLDIQYIDWNLVEKLLNNFPQVDFHFAGQWESKAQFLQICNKSNFYFYGKLSANDLPSFYKNMDLLILVYKYEKYPEQLANPHKLMEYLSSGKMILATWTDEYFTLLNDGVIKMEKEMGAYISSFYEILNNMDYWNNNELMKSRKKFANENTYENQISKIEKIIKDNS